jgi:hypothetical protein
MPTAAEATLGRWLRAGAIYSIVVGLPLAAPGGVDFTYTALNRLNRLLALGGHWLERPNAPVDRIFIAAAGAAVTVLGVLLLWAARDVRARVAVAVADALHMIAFGLAVVWGVLFHHVARIVLPIGVADLTFGIAFLMLARRISGR